jgi:hypothetical protein
MKLPEILTTLHLELASVVKILTHGGMSIFVRNSLKFNQINVMHLCMVQDTECCAIQLESKFPHTYVLAIYRAPTGDFEQFISK